MPQTSPINWIVISLLATITINIFLVNNFLSSNNNINNITLNNNINILWIW